MNSWRHRARDRQCTQVDAFGATRLGSLQCIYESIKVVANLIHNAVDAMNSEAGPWVLTVRTERLANNKIAIAVEDTGPGVSPQDAETIFDAFVTTKPSGMGLGLAISKMIVERHAGTLSVSSAIPRGAIFRVTLPAA